jgi:lysophospholipase L1-like esterase
MEINSPKSTPPLTTVGRRAADRRDRWPREFRTMVALGESTTAGGWSSAPDRCWVPLLAALISDIQESPVRCVNSGIGANVISTKSPCYEYSGKPAATERLEKHVFAHDPDLVLVSYGLNDARGGTPLDLFCQELALVVRRIKAATSALVVLLGPYYMVDFQRGGGQWDRANLQLFYQFNEATAKIARDEDCLFVNILAANGETGWMVHYDGVHANDLGHRIIANEVFKVLAQNCSGLAVHTKALERVSPRWRDESVLKADYGY